MFLFSTGLYRSVLGGSGGNENLDLAWERFRLYKSIQDRIKARKTSQTKIFIPIIPFLTEKDS